MYLERPEGAIETCWPYNLIVIWGYEYWIKHTSNLYTVTKNKQTKNSPIHPNTYIHDKNDKWNNLQLMVQISNIRFAGPVLDHNQTQQQGPQLWKTHGFKRWIQGPKRQAKKKTRAVSLSKHQCCNCCLRFPVWCFSCLSICEHVIFPDRQIICVSMMLLSRHTILTFPHVNCYKLKIWMG